MFSTRPVHEKGHCHINHIWLYNSPHIFLSSNVHLFLQYTNINPHVLHPPQDKIHISSEGRAKNRNLMWILERLLFAVENLIDDLGS